ncbi:hypothetical protein IWQ55_000275 [Labrenzia sp. EL_208]|nr:hypothetical protein [Labrenzia sp. EL_132]MBG6227083.1 hypothetical protein [Labrenzia sp. EL_208]
MLMKLQRTNGDPVLINPLAVTTVIKARDHGGTVINTLDCESGIWVKETPVEIHEQQLIAAERLGKLAALLKGMHA